MSSAFRYRERIVWGSNGAIEEILLKLIRLSPEDSALLAWAVGQYREFWPGCVCELSAVLGDPAVQADWRATMAEALTELKTSGGWSEYGQAWLEANKQDLIGLAEPIDPEPHPEPPHS